MHLPPLPDDSKTFRILVVDDDDSIGRLVSLYLSHAGFDPRVAPDGDLGWEAFCDVGPHLAILDVSMPGMSGWDLARKIREDSAIPILMLTAADTDENQIKGFKLGADDFVPKPFRATVLLARVIAHLRRVYKYQHGEVAPETPHLAPLADVPEGWFQCEACEYMGPQFKFEAVSSGGERSLVCPHCKNTQLTFLLHE